MKLDVYRQIFEKKSSNIMKIRPVGAKMLREYGQTDGET